MKGCLIAGIDFIISKGRPYFIEANSAPGSRSMEILADEGFNPLEKFGELIERKFHPKNVVSLYTTKDSGDLYRKKVLEKFFNVRLCGVEEFGKNGENPVPDLVLFNKWNFSQLCPFSVEKVNSDEVVRITIDKHLSTIIANNAGVLTPKTYLSTSSKNAADIIEGVGLKSYVVKGNFGQAGAGVLFSGNKVGPVKGIKIIQEKIDVAPHSSAKFWDVRVIVVDGKFEGAVVRYSNNPAVNVHLGGKIEAASEEVMDMVRKPAEKVVDAIDKAALTISGQRL